MSNRDARLLKNDPYQRQLTNQIASEEKTFFSKFRSLCRCIKSYIWPEAAAEIRGANTHESIRKSSQHLGVGKMSHILADKSLESIRISTFSNYAKEDKAILKSKAIQTDMILQPEPRPAVAIREPVDPSTYYERVINNINREKKEYERREKAQRRRNSQGVPPLISSGIITKIENIGKEISVLNQTFTKINEEKNDKVLLTKEKPKEGSSQNNQVENEILTATSIKSLTRPSTENKFLFTNQKQESFTQKVEIAPQIILPQPKIKEQETASLEFEIQEKKPKEEKKSESKKEELKSPPIYILSPLNPLPSTPVLIKTEEIPQTESNPTPKFIEPEKPKPQIKSEQPLPIPKKESQAKEAILPNKPQETEINPPISQLEKVPKVEIILDAPKENKVSIPKLEESKPAPKPIILEADSKMQFSDEKAKPDSMSAPIYQMPSTNSINPFASTIMPPPNGFEIFKKADVPNSFNEFNNCPTFIGSNPFQAMGNAYMMGPIKSDENAMEIEHPRSSLSRDPFTASPFSQITQPMQSIYMPASAFQMNQLPPQNTQNIFENSNPFSQSSTFNPNPINLVEQSGNQVSQFLATNNSIKDKDDDLFQERRRK